MRNFIIMIIGLFAVLLPVSYVQSYDSQFSSNHYNQYSPNDLSNPYSQNEVQYSPKNLSNPYSQYEVQYAPEKASQLSVQEDHDYHANVMLPPSQDQAVKAAKESPEDAAISRFFGNGKPKKEVPVFLYLLILSVLAVVATMTIAISIFKK